MTESKILATGNLAAPYRTICGIRMQMDAIGLEKAIAEGYLKSAGIPEIAYSESNHPISLDQELKVLEAILEDYLPGVHPIEIIFNAERTFGIHNFDYLGLAMQFAPTILDALKTVLEFPQLCWGHSYLTVKRTPDSLVVSFSVDKNNFLTLKKPQLLMNYCEVINLFATNHAMHDICSEVLTPTSISLMCSKPENWQELSKKAPCPIYFDSAANRLTYPPDTEKFETKSNLKFKHEALKKDCADLVWSWVNSMSTAEQVSSLLWAFDSPPNSQVVSDLLKISPLKLSRELRKEGTTFTELVNQTQLYRAKNLLADDKLSISEVGFALGYSEIATFTRAFKKWCGLSPTDYKDSLK